MLYITNTNSQPTSLASPTHLASEAELRAAPLRAAPLEVERLVASKLLEGRVVEGRVRGVARRRVASGGATDEAWGEARGGVVVRRLVGLLDSPLEPSDHLLELALLERVILARLVRGLGKLHEHLTQLARTMWCTECGVRSALTSSARRLAVSALLVAFLAAFNSVFKSSSSPACSSCALSTALSTA